MTERAGTLQRVALELARLLRPIAARLGDDQVLETFAELGVQFPNAFLTQSQISAARATVRGTAGQLEPLVAQLVTAMDGGDTPGMTAGGLQVIEQCGRVTASFDELTNALRSAGPSLPGISQQQIDDLVTDLPRKLLDLLLAGVLELSAPVAAVLETLGVVIRQPDPGNPADPTKPDFDRLTVRLDRLLPALTDPLGLLSSVYHWGDASFDTGALLGVLEGALGRLGLPVLLQPASGGNPVELQAFALDIKPTTSGSPPGLAFEVVLPGAAESSFDFPLTPPDWIAHIALKGALPVGTTGTVRPPFQAELTPPDGVLAGSATAGLTVHPAKPVVVLGEPGGSRLEFAGLSAQAGITLAFADGKATAGPTVEGEITDGKLVIDLASGDGFLQTVVGGGGRIEAGFGVGFTFDPAGGLRFHGSGSLDIRIPLHLRIGPVDLRAVNLAVKPGPVMPVELSADLNAALGPVRAAVERVGVIATLGFPSGGGNLGPVQLDFAFKPPNGVGLSVDVAMLKGGGFLYADPDRGEYAGALELRLAGFLDVKAIGLISTRLPGGGFSLLIILSAEFGGGGLQLGYGFTLLAVGGLIGLNRTMNLQALMEGVRSGAVESVMFPKDVVANAPRILSDLRAFFPPQDGTFLIGPMAKLGWGTPTLVSVSVGVIVEIPGNIAIVGVLKVALPAQDLPVMVLQVNFAGAIEFDRKRLYFFAALFDSHVLMITIEGEMGLLVAWGDDASVLLTVGGFHPAFTPPPLPFPSPRRVSIDIVNQPLARIRASGYFAVTSNTVQFGAAADLFFGFSELSVEGHIGFDALFRFSPFSFTIHIAASVSLKAFGVGVFSISLDFALEGPTPWRAHGRGSIGFLFFEISADFDITWGEARDTTLPPVDVMPLLAGELAKLEGWQTRAPAIEPLVTLRVLSPGRDGPVLHPMGTLCVRQHAVPLGLKLDRIGAQRPNDVNRCTVDVTGSGLHKVADVPDMFALAQF
ncbi:DUF6603 domain-containing protein, partial [Streptomyces sp. NPDC049577]|uniref:DUF6603 domain-containing protein n=1 Tax=Streptomyces sp. NPDC049577 TaxID=3155153 RepID=UPI0034478843